MRGGQQAAGERVGVRSLPRHGAHSEGLQHCTVSFTRSGRPYGESRSGSSGSHMLRTWTPDDRQDSSFPFSESESDFLGLCNVCVAIAISIECFSPFTIGNR